MGKRRHFLLTDNILDLVFETEADKIGVVEIYPTLPRCHHCPVIFEYVLQQCVKGDVGQNGSLRLWEKVAHDAVSWKLWSTDCN